MTQRWFAILAAGFLLVGARAAAQPARGLTLDDALALARTQSRDLRAARARLEQSAAGVEQAWVALLPQLSAQGKYTRNYREVVVDLSQANQGLFGLAEVIKGTSRNPVQNGAINAFEQQAAARLAAQPTPVISKLDQLDFALNATVPLVVPSAYPALTAARRGHASSQASYSVTEAQLLYAVAQAYYAAAGTDELVIARRHAITVARQTFDNARARFEAGVVNRVELTRAEVALVRVEQAEAETEDSQAQAHRALATLLDLHEEFRVTPESPVSAEPAPAADLVASALHLRPDFAVYQRQIAADDSNARAAAWRWAPTLSAFGNLRAFNYQGFSGDYYAWAVGAQLDWLLYDGGARDAARHLAGAQRRETEARFALLRDSITDEVMNARRALGTKRRALDTAHRAFSLSNETLALVRAQYEAGTVKQLDLLEAQDALIAAEVQVAEARFDLALADLTLRRTAGTFPDSRSAR